MSSKKMKKQNQKNAFFFIFPIFVFLQMGLRMQKWDALFSLNIFQSFLNFAVKSGRKLHNYIVKLNFLFIYFIKDWHQIVYLMVC